MPAAGEMAISYYYSSIVPLSVPTMLNPLELSSGSKTFLTAFWIILFYLSIAAVRFLEFSENLQKMNTSSSVFKWIFFFNFWILLMIYLANPLIFNYSSCLVSNKTITLSPPIDWYSWMFYSTNLYLIMISSI